MMGQDIFVAGLGRCGTTAMMNLLLMGGAPIAGPPPAFEMPEMGVGRVDLEWLDAQRGTALKWIDPTATRIPNRPAQTIWMERDPAQQARSMAKLINLEMARGNIKRIERSIRQQSPKVRANLKARGPMLRIRFEDLLKDPSLIAFQVQDFLGAEFFPDAGAAARVILPRGPECQADMRIEENLIRAWDGAGHAERHSVLA